MTTASESRRADGAANFSAAVGDASIDLAAEISRLSTATGGEAGALVFFSGAVRGGEVSAMTLEQYPPMTERALLDIAACAVHRFSLSAARIVHRTGRMTPGEIIVFVAAAAARRHDAFAACQYMTDYLKTRAPFWKKEETAAGDRWVTASAADEAARRQWEAE